MIETKNLSFSYPASDVIDGVSLCVRDGEVAVLLGANGAGKSTLLKVMSGFLKPRAGCVLHNGRDISALSAGEIARGRAVLEQECALAFDYSVLETAMLGSYARSRFALSEEVLARKSLERAGMKGFENRKYSRLSGGEKRRVQLARALCQLGEERGGKILLLDEPSSGLDPAHAHAAMAAARDAARDGASVVAVLHDANLAAAYADKIALLKNGKILKFAPSREVLTADLLSQVYNTPCEIVESSRGFFVSFPPPQ